MRKNNPSPDISRSVSPNMISPKNKTFDGINQYIKINDYSKINSI